MLIKTIQKLTLFLLAVALPLPAAYTVKNGKVMNLEEVATLSAQEHHTLLLEAIEGKNWDFSIKQANVIIKNFPDSPFFQEAFYFLAVAYFNTRDFDVSNKNLNLYLRKQTALRHFREAIELKFQIAEKFREGYRKHIGGYEFLPKWMPAKEEAIEIYDEVIQALPNDDLAAKSLFGRGILQLEQEEYTASIETYQTLIRRFSRHPLSPDAYVEIIRVYLVQSQEKFPDANYLDLAEISLRKFRQEFPLDARLVEAEHIFAQMQEVFAQNFYETAQFYERTKKPHASILYYSKIIKTFPNTESAELSKKRLKVLQPPSEVSLNHGAKQENFPIPEPTPSSD